MKEDAQVAEEQKPIGKKPLNSFNVISKQEHKGFGTGMIDLSNLSSIIIDEGEAYIDQGAIHAKSKIERGIKFTTNRDEVPNGRKCWVVWVAVARDGGEPYYGGVSACEMRIDAEEKKGWKILADHVNKMDYALKRRFILDGLDEAEKAALRRRLIEHNPEWWDRSPEELKEKLA